MNYSNDTLAKFYLFNDMIAKNGFSQKEQEKVYSCFYNGDMSEIFSFSPEQLYDRFCNKALALKVYNKLKNFDKTILSSLEQNGIRLVGEYDDNYPKRLKAKLHKSAPKFLYAVGNLDLLNAPSSAVTGARKTNAKGQRFACEIGEIIALEKRVLVTGGAYGCDRIASESAAKNGGKIVWFVANPLGNTIKDRFVQKLLQENRICVCSDFNPFGAFQAEKALTRNKYIYANSEFSFVCQCNGKISGTFSGASYCLKNNLSELFLLDCENEASKILIDAGAIAVTDK